MSNFEHKRVRLNLKLPGSDLALHTKLFRFQARTISEHIFKENLKINRYPLPVGPISGMNVPGYWNLPYFVGLYIPGLPSLPDFKQIVSAAIEIKT